jgi:kynurenine formamidase
MKKMSNHMRVIDLTMTIDAEIPVFPGSPKPQFIPWTNMSSQGYDSESAFLSTHTGTHMDAPSHFIRKAHSIDRIEPQRFISSGIILRLQKREDEPVEVEDLSSLNVLQGDTVLISTGWQKRIHRISYYFSRNPGLSKDAANYLAKKKVNAVGIDTPSIDLGTDESFSAHKILLRSDILIVEHLCNMDKIRKERFTVVLSPLKLAGASGSPIRALALV